MIDPDIARVREALDLIPPGIIVAGDVEDALDRLATRIRDLDANAKDFYERLREAERAVQTQYEASCEAIRRGEVAEVENERLYEALGRIGRLPEETETYNDFDTAVSIARSAISEKPE